MSQNTKRYHETSKFNIQYLKTTVVKKKKVFNIVYRSVWCFKYAEGQTIRQIHQSTPLLSIFSLMLQCTKDSLRNMV